MLYAGMYSHFMFRVCVFLFTSEIILIYISFLPLAILKFDTLTKPTTLVSCSDSAHSVHHVCFLRLLSFSVIPRSFNH